MGTYNMPEQQSAAPTKSPVKRGWVGVIKNLPKKVFTGEYYIL